MYSVTPQACPQHYYNWETGTWKKDTGKKTGISLEIMVTYAIIWLSSKKAEAASVYGEVEELQGPLTQIQQPFKCAIAAGKVAVQQGELAEIQGVGTTYIYAS